MRLRIGVFVTVVQSILFLAHAFLYWTWVSFWGTPAAVWKLQVAFAVLSVSFVSATMLGLRHSHPLIGLLYTVSAVWLGVMSFCVFAACAAWIVYAIGLLLGLHVERRIVAGVLFGLAMLASLYGLVNAAWTRVKRVTVNLPNLSPSWRGRVAALVTDIHLGNIRTQRFAQRIVRMLRRLEPDIVFIGGDLYDGAAANLEKLAKPWANLRPPLGAYFVVGNHEEFSSRTKYLDAMKRSGVRILNNEKVDLDGMQVIGIQYGESRNPERLRLFLRKASIDRRRASILLIHEPDRLRIAEEEGISLQLSGHTHAGQFFPFTWITSRIYRQYVYGLQRFGNLLVYVSCGVGTWGPPMRIGTKPEIVLIRFE